MKPVWIVALLAAVALAYGISQDMKAAAFDRRRAAAEAASALLAAQRDSALRVAQAQRQRADSERAGADEARAEGAALAAAARRPVSVQPPDTTLRDSVRYERAAHAATLGKLDTALAVIAQDSVAYTKLSVAFASQSAALASLQSSLAAASARGDSLENALRAAPRACPRFLGLPAPRVGVGAALTTGGLGPAVGVFIPLGC